MPEIYSVIPDTVLRQAIHEGILLTEAGGFQEAADLVSALKDNTAKAIILDESAADKKALKALENMVEQRNCRVFLLGETDAAWKDHLAVESFSKPLRLGHLLARILFHLRTRPRLQNTSMILGPWRLELQNRQIVRQDNENIIRLTEKETALLDYIAQSDAPVGREELLAAVWGHDGRIDTHTLETHIYQLRRKLDPEGNGTNFLVNEQGAYCLKPR